MAADGRAPLDDHGEPDAPEPGAAAALAVDRLGEDADEAFCRACHTATGGNPLFLRELLRGAGGRGSTPVGRSGDVRSRTSGRPRCGASCCIA